MSNSTPISKEQEEKIKDELDIRYPEHLQEFNCKYRELFENGMREVLSHPDKYFTGQQQPEDLKEGWIEGSAEGFENFYEDNVSEYAEGSTREDRIKEIAKLIRHIYSLPKPESGNLQGQGSREAWDAALTLANNYCVQISDRYNNDDHIIEAGVADECAKAIRSEIGKGREYLASLSGTGERG